MEYTENIENKEAEKKLYAESAIHPAILRAVQEMGFEEMTPIQAQAIPVLLEGKDVIGQAQTGTGKTAAFGIPTLQRIDPANRKLQALILCPTRELAIQAAEEIRRFAKFMQGIKVLPIYGGQDITKQIRSLKNEVQIVVGTPGRVMDHMRRHTLKLGDVNMVVLDEADEMLNMGFREDIETILEGIPKTHQTALFSATMPKPIMDITKNYQHDAVLVKVTQKEVTIPLVKQYYYEVRREQKQEAMCRLLDYYNPKRSLIFCNTKRMVDEISDALKGRGYFAEGLHGDMSQRQRDNVMDLFRNGRIEILIATDVAARGIDVDDVEAVFNYDVPQDIEYYVHRIGRTGRAGRKGRAFTLIAGREIFKIRDIERSCKTKIKQKSIPSVKDITNNKADKILSEVIECVKEQELTDMIRILEERLGEEDMTSLELAAGFLKMHMGEALEEIDFEASYRKGKREYGARKDGERKYNKHRDFKEFGDGKRKGARHEEWKPRDKKNDSKKHGKKKNDEKKDGRKKTQMSYKEYERLEKKRKKDKKG